MKSIHNDRTKRSERMKKRVIKIPKDYFKTNIWSDQVNNMKMSLMNYIFDRSNQWKKSKKDDISSAELTILIFIGIYILYQFISNLPAIMYSIM